MENDAIVSKQKAKVEIKIAMLVKIMMAFAAMRNGTPFTCSTTRGIVAVRPSAAC